MSSYTIPSLTFLLSNFSSMILSILLIVILLKSSSYLTKWTLFQTCLAALGYSLFSVLKVLKYGDNSREAFDQPICIIQQKLMMLFFYPLYLLPNVLTFYLWVGIINFNLSIEKTYFWTL